MWKFVFLQIRWCWIIQSEPTKVNHQPQKILAKNPTTIIQTRLHQWKYDITNFIKQSVCHVWFQDVMVLSGICPNSRIIMPLNMQSIICVYLRTVANLLIYRKFLSFFYERENFSVSRLMCSGVCVKLEVANFFGLDRVKLMEARWPTAQHCSTFARNIEEGQRTSVSVSLI